MINNNLPPSTSNPPQSAAPYSAMQNLPPPPMNEPKFPGDSNYPIYAPNPSYFQQHGPPPPHPHSFDQFYHSVPLNARSYTQSLPYQTQPLAQQIPPPKQRSYSTPTTSKTVYSFVPLPGSQQQKRPRRRFEEIERIYHCNFDNCTKAYGTLNHLNAHVTMQKHGPKRTPDEFKETRREYKARKKEQEKRLRVSKEQLQVQQAQQVQQQQSYQRPLMSYDSSNTLPPPLNQSPLYQYPNQNSLYMGNSNSNSAAPAPTVHGTESYPNYYQNPVGPINDKE
ncbi:hypothetical protein DV451_000710 [Geotrichum candidum]|uniref:C2H2-type domain-containing protein n=1 Tax=Geotrichum candidum TaxID=1173061 RepID=A0A9P5G806_GEOCN|nr:hypothetical protein DV451_000710 [Geotrichum candidum]KAF5105250.1 hypothetical protein DV453_005012 [Geotrichum candidum]KAF5109472.1 hypothetical protein DV454_005001 [Geotrichum candidum]KAI9211052.1 hypothetical protein DS838_004063 [Geotrichum bryndzae]